MKKMEVHGQTYIVTENHHAGADEELSVSANCTVKGSETDFILCLICY